MGLPDVKSKLLRARLPKGREWLLLGTGAVIALIPVGVAVLINRSQVPLKPESSVLTIAWLPDTVKRWEKPIIEMSKAYNIDPNLLAIVMTLESGGYSQAGSEADAKGLMQVTPPTAKDIAAKFLQTPLTSYDLLDERTNIEFGAAYLAWLRDEFGTADQGPSWNSTVELIAAGYNGGPGAANNLEQGKGLLDTQTVVYSRDAFNMWRERHAKTSPTYDRWLERGGSRLIDLAKAQDL